MEQRWVAKWGGPWDGASATAWAGGWGASSDGAMDEGWAKASDMMLVAERWWVRECASGEELESAWARGLGLLREEA